MHHNLKELRKEYSLAMLDELHTNTDPILQFKKWFQEAMDAQIIEPYAMTISTVNSAHRPSSRVVLLRDVSVEGFSFYTNYLSRKGQDLAVNPFAAMNFFWPELERQVRIEGKIVPLEAFASDAYFASRPRGSQIGAWSSPQSEIIESRKVLEDAVENYIQQFDGKDVERPPHWGGYCLIPDYIEFWQGRESRLHDRICYYQHSDGSWVRSRLAP
jgi:pyridoxamine 5'-phosphate oxidase